MTDGDVLDAIEALGLSNSEAQVFFAVQRLDSGTALAVNDDSGVPRSQGSGAAADFAEKRLVEGLEASPKAYRSVTLATARDILTERLERERSRAFEHLESIRREDVDRDASGDVSTLRGRRSIDDRVVALLDRAERRAVVAPAADSLTDDIVTARAENATGGVRSRSSPRSASDRPRPSPVRRVRGHPRRRRPGAAGGRPERPARRRDR